MEHSSSPPGSRASPSFTSLTDVDSTVLAYAQWLSELQQHANQAKYHQKAELEVLREAVSAQSSELNDFKRHCMGAIQQIQQQVSDVKINLAAVQSSITEMKSSVSSMKSNVSDMKTNVSEMRAGRDLGLGSDPFLGSEGLSPKRPGSPTGRSTATFEISKIHRALGEVQEQTISKFGEVDQAMNVLHGQWATLHKELQASEKEWKKSQELLSQAIGAVSHDLQDFQTHVTGSTKKSQVDILQLQEGRRSDTERLSRMETQVMAIHQNVQTNANEIILLGDLVDRCRPVSPQRRMPVPMPGQNLEPSSHGHLLNLLDQQERIRAGVRR